MRYFSDEGFMQAISGVSTNYGSQLDCVFTNNLACTCSYYESYFSDHKPVLITLNTGEFSNSDLTENRGVITQVPSDSISSSTFDILHIHNKPEADEPEIITHVFLPPPLAPPIHLSSIANTFTYAMRQTLADGIGVHGIPLRPTNFHGRTTASNYYSILRDNIQDRFNFRIVPVLADGNCFFRTLSHIIFGDESEHHNVRISLLNTFEQSNYVAALCGLQGYNEVTIQEHLNAMRLNYTWGSVNELIILGILARINVSYINATNQDPSKWVITDVYSGHTLGIPNDPIFEGKYLVVLFHSIGFSGPSANHYDAVYKLQ